MKKCLHNKKIVHMKTETTKRETKIKSKSTNKKVSVDKKSDSVIYQQKKKMYIGFFPRLILNVIFFFIFICSSFYFIGTSILINPSKKISYTEKSNLDYRVYLKENDFYESEYLGKNMSYVASLINYIDLFFDYDFNVDILMDTNFDYKIVAVLNIDNETSSSSYFSKEYTLLEKNNQMISTTNSFHIHEKVQLDYDYYNRLANHFKATYGVGTNSNLDVYLKVNRNISSENLPNHELDGQNSMSIHIPLSQKAISINMSYDEIKDQDSIISDGKIQVRNMKLFLIGILFLILAIVFFIKVYHKLKILMNKNSRYDNYIRKILKEYDRLIVVTETMPNLDKFQVFKLNDFSELLDVRDNIKKPIMYYNVAKHMKCYFYLKDDADIYLLCVKAVDMEN